MPWTLRVEGECDTQSGYWYQTKWEMLAEKAGSHCGCLLWWAVLREKRRHGQEKEPGTFRHGRTPLQCQPWHTLTIFVFV